MSKSSDSENDDTISIESDQDTISVDSNRVENPTTTNQDVIVFIERDLLDVSTNWAHCISADCVMGAGIAKKVVARCGGTAFRQAVALQAKPIGDVAVIIRGAHYIYNLVTKQRYNDKPTLASVEASLKALKQHMRDNGVSIVAMPRIGCGLDRLAWSDVEPLIRSVFAGSDMKIIVCSLPSVD
jgi:O-acetyl-ADP-ribose deacetylase (regulator of RNase III)